MEGKVLALDYGTKKVGLAGGDLQNRVALPKGVIRNRGTSLLVAEILKYCLEWDYRLIIVGLPLKMEGRHLDNPVMTDVRYFVSELRKAGKDQIEVRFMDERLSSYEANQLMDSLDEQNEEKLGKDAYSAQIILQRFFDKQAD